MSKILTSIICYFSNHPFWGSWGHSPERRQTAQKCSPLRAKPRGFLCGWEVTPPPTLLEESTFHQKRCKLTQSVKGVITVSPQIWASCSSADQAFSVSGSSAACLLLVILQAKLPANVFDTQCRQMHIALQAAGGNRLQWLWDGSVAVTRKPLQNP